MRMPHLIMPLLLTAPLLADEPQKAVRPTPSVTKARLLPGKYVACEPTVAADGKGRVAVVAIGGFELGRGNTRLLLWRSDDDGLTWKLPTRLHESKDFGKSQADPWLQSLAPRKFAIAYMGASTDKPGLPAAVFQQSEDAGKTWTEPHTFYRGVDKTVLAASPSGKHLAVAFIDFDSDNKQNVHVHRSADQGKTWQELPAAFALKKNIYQAQGIVVNDKGAIAAGWSVQMGRGKRHMHLTTTTDGGKNWTNTDLPFDPLDDLDFAGPALALDGVGRVHAMSIRLDNTKDKLDVLLRSTEDFKTWSEPIVLASGQDAEYRGYPAIAATGRRIHVAWMERKDKWYRVCYRGSIDGGKTWSDRVLLSQPEKPSDLLTAEGFKSPFGHYMTLAEDGTGIVHAVWGAAVHNGFDEKNPRGEIWHNAIRWRVSEK